MGFFRNQQIKAAVRLLSWQYEKNESERPNQAFLQRQAEKLVDDAHRIARERGGNVLSILKEMAADIFRK